MKNITLTSLRVVILFAVPFSLFSQTNVSGGIYTNTTWTKVNSPYIVTDTVVVFPGVTLTIEPGVVVKFANDKRLEVRQAKLIAEGTITDTITFTSNSGSPFPGIWGEIFCNNASGPDTIKFNYCNFTYANRAINFHARKTLTIKNSNFLNNKTGIYSHYLNGSFAGSIDSTDFINNLYGIDGGFWGVVNYCKIKGNQVGLYGQGWKGEIRNCTVDSNQTGIEVSGASIDNCVVIFNQRGIKGGGGWRHVKNSTISYNNIVGLFVAGDSIINCEIKYNGIGFQDWVAHDSNVITKSIIEYNSIGIQIEGSVGNSISKVYCNKICNNLIHDLYYNKAFGRNATFPNNYWCTPDSASTAGVIYDGYDYINLGLVSFMPLDTAQCYLNPGNCSAYFGLIPDTTILHYYYAVNMANGTGPLTYLWTWGDGFSDTAAYPSHTYASAGFYTICLSITDSVGCTSSYCNSFHLHRNTNSMVYVNVVPALPTDISNLSTTTPNFVLSPNPATSTVTINIDETLLGGTATLTDITGRTLAAVNLTTVNAQLTTENIANGVYFVTVTDKEGRSATKKLVVSK